MLSFIPHYYLCCCSTRSCPGACVWANNQCRGASYQVVAYACCISRSAVLGYCSACQARVQYTQTCKCGRLYTRSLSLSLSLSLSQRDPCTSYITEKDYVYTAILNQNLSTRVMRTHHMHSETHIYTHTRARTHTHLHSYGQADMWKRAALSPHALTSKAWRGPARYSAQSSPIPKRKSILFLYRFVISLLLLRIV